MRSLKFSDIGKASNIIKKMNLRANEDMKGADIESVGASLFLKLIENYGMVQNDVAEFMSSMLEDEGVTKQSYMDRQLDEVIQDFKKLSEDEGFVNFTKSLKGMITTK